MASAQAMAKREGDATYQLSAAMEKIAQELNVPGVDVQAAGRARNPQMRQIEKIEALAAWATEVAAALIDTRVEGEQTEVDTLDEEAPEQASDEIEAGAPEPADDLEAVGASHYENMTVPVLREIARMQGVNPSGLKKAELITALVEAQA